MKKLTKKDRLTNGRLDHLRMYGRQLTENWVDTGFVFPRIHMIHLTGRVIKMDVWAFGGCGGCTRHHGGGQQCSQTIQEA